MTELFLTNLKIKKARHIENIDIPLSTSERKHLIFTGRNGAGKTTVLLEILTFLRNSESGILKNYIKLKKNEKSIEDEYVIFLERSDTNRSDQAFLNERDRPETNLEYIKQDLDSFGGTELTFNNFSDAWKAMESGKFVLAYFEDKRKAELVVPKGINKVDLNRRLPVAARIIQRSGLELLAV